MGRGSSSGPSPPTAGPTGRGTSGGSSAKCAVSRWAIGHVNAHDREPCVFYFHPWELDAQQPRVAGIGAKTRFRHYINIPRMERRLRALCADFSWDRVDRVFALPDAAAGAPARELATA